MSKTVSINGLCDDLGIGRTKAFQLIAAGAVDAIKVGRRTLITQHSIDALIERGIAEAKRARGL